jgi:hypothetical protein
VHHWQVLEHESDSTKEYKLAEGKGDHHDPDHIQNKDYLC